MELLEALYHCQNSAEIDCLNSDGDEEEEKHYSETLPKAIKVVGKFMKKLEKNPDIEKITEQLKQTKNDLIATQQELEWEREQWENYHNKGNKNG